MSTRVLVLAALACSALASPLHSQLYIDLPVGSWVNDITPDGRVVVGTWDFGDGFIWRWQEDPSPTIVLGGDMVGVSDDGSVVAGNAFDASVGTVVASIWTEAEGWQSLDFLPGGPCGPNSYSTAYDISGDGTTIVGLGWDGCSALGFRWTEATGMQPLQNLVNGTNRCSTISGDGSAMGGFAQGSFTRTPAYWNPDTSGFVINPDFDGEVFGFTEDGGLSVGTNRITGEDYYAFVRDASTGVMTDLGSLNNNWDGQATDISEDGNTIVGMDVNGLAREAWIWTSSDGMISVDDRLVALGISGAEDAFVCRAVSDDGNIVVGGGFDGGGGAFGFGGFILALSDLTWTNLGNGLAGTGGLTPALAGDGELTSGATTTLSLTDALPGASAYFILGLTDLSLPFKAGVLVPSVDILIPNLPVDPAGGIEFSFAWPAGVPSGASLYYQYWILDAGGPVGFAASNGLQSTTP